MKTAIYMMIIGMLAAQAAFAGPLSDVIEGAGEAVGRVGGTAVDTVESAGESIKGTAARYSDDFSPAEARRDVDSMESQTLGRLFKLDRKAKALFDISYGYAVFDSRKSSFLLTVGRGSGVAVNRRTGRRTYMQMAAAGANLGYGLKYFHNVFLFQDQQAFDKFVNFGWEAGTSGGAAFGRDSLDAEVHFIDGLAVFQMSDTGVMLAADVTGTKYWKDGKLNS